MDLISQISSRTHLSKSICVLDVLGRIARALLDLVEKMGGKREFDTKLVMSEITGVLGVATGTIRQFLYELEIAGYIKVKKGKVIINEELY